jgi:hypothetical protein
MSEPVKDPLIIFAEHGNVSSRQIKKMEEKGATVILVKDISKIAVVNEQIKPELQELFFIALASIRNCTYAPAELGKQLCEKLYKDSGYYDWSKKKPSSS